MAGSTKRRWPYLWARWLVFLYLVYYLRHVKKPSVLTRNVFMKKMIEELGLGKRWYWPAFFAPGGIAQAVAYILRSSIFRRIGNSLVKRVTFDTEALRTKTNDLIHIHWVKERPQGSKNRPVVMFWGGITTTKNDPMCQATCTKLMKAGYEPVVYSRRGIAAESERFSIMENPVISEQAVDHVCHKRPAQDVYIIAFSAGTGCCFIYIMDMALGDLKYNDRVKGVVNLSPGYTTNHFQFPEFDNRGSRLIGPALNAKFLPPGGKNEKRNPRGVELCRTKSGGDLVACYHEIFSDFPGNYGGWTKHCEPLERWNKMDSLSGEDWKNIRMPPYLVFNARDDPIFPWDLWGQFKHHFLKRSMGPFALVATDHGGHVTYYEGLTMGNWAVKRGIDFFNYLERVEDIPTTADRRKFKAAPACRRLEEQKMT